MSVDAATFSGQTGQGGEVQEKSKKPLETPYDRFESLMKRLVAVPKEEVVKPKVRSSSSKNKKRPKSR